MTDILHPDPSRVCGVDTDFYLKFWDPQKAKQNGVQFAFIRACQNVWPDAEFAHSWAASKGVMPRGAYIYLTKQISNDGQARQFASMFPNGVYDGELPIVVDLEEELAAKQLYASDMDAFLLALPKYLKGWDGKYIVYTGYSWWRTFGNKNLKYADVPLWIANPPPYGNPSQQFSPALLAPFKRVVFDQTSFAGDGILYGGTSKGIDLDYYLGTEAQFKAEFGIGELVSPVVILPPVIIQPGGTTVKGIAKALVNIKPMAGGSAIDQMMIGEVVYGNLTSSGFDLIDINRVYKSDGVTIARELAVPCKVSAGSWINVGAGTEPTAPPPPPAVVVKVHQIETMSNGSLVIDGKPYVAI